MCDLEKIRSKLGTNHYEFVLIEVIFGWKTMWLKSLLLFFFLFFVKHAVLFHGGIKST